MIIGLTGGIGSGKSTVANALVAYAGWALYDTDSEAKRIIVENPTVRRHIIDLFGPEAYDGDTYQTAFVASRVFADSDLLQRLNAIVHPAVREDILRRHNLLNPLSAWIPSPATRWLNPLNLLIESAILFESGLDAICDKTIAIVTPEELRLERIMQRDNIDIQKVRARMRAQMSDDERSRRADLTIHYTNRNDLVTICPYIVQHL